MEKFWGVCENDRFKVGCGGAATYIFNKDGEELAKFEDIPDAYRAVFQPNSNILCVKSAEGALAFYDLNKPELLKKIRYTDIGAQDEGFAFSPDGKFFYNIEKPRHSLRTQLTIYRTEDFEVEKTLFADKNDMHLERIEFDGKKCFLLGFMRNEVGLFDYGFVCRLENDEITDMKRIEEGGLMKRLCIERGMMYTKMIADSYAHRYVDAYKNWQEHGFTDKKMETSFLRSFKKVKPISLKRVFINEGKLK